MGAGGESLPLHFYRKMRGELVVMGIPRRLQACRRHTFIEKLPHIKGEWAKAGGRIVLQPWQIFILTTVFGWVHRETGLRRFRIVYIEVPRKNGKSTFSAGVGIYCTCADGEEGAEVYSAATTSDQAKIVWKDAHTWSSGARGSSPISA